MAAMTYYVALAFMKSEGGGEIVACDPKEARSSEHAIRLANVLASEAGHCGAIGFFRPAIRLLAILTKRFLLEIIGEVDIGLLSA
jgi:hypothetical protein